MILEIYYHEDNYERPINFTKINDKTYKVSSSYWNDDIGICVDNKITFANLGIGIISNNLIDFGNNNTWHSDKRKNVLFIGANKMDEPHEYYKLYKNGLFIEAIPDVYEQLKNSLEKLNNIYNTNYIAINALVTSEENKEYMFNVFNLNDCSSIYEPNDPIWNEKWWSLKVDHKIKLISTTIKKILLEYGWENITYDVILDVQGAEMEVLMGFGENNFKNVESLKVEFSTKEFYKGGTQFDELNKFLISRRFKLMHLPNCDHGDANYKKI